MDWVVVVDDDKESLLQAARILSKAQIKVTQLSSGEDFLQYIEGMTPLPDLILMDLHMPGIDGFETMQRMQEKIGKDSIPVIFLTGEEDRAQEHAALKLGAHDFILKPYIPEIMLLRVQHTIELTRLQKSLTKEVDRKTRENNQLTFHMVQTLAEAIDAKDTYTNGHSGRVASYSREIAKRLGYSEHDQNEIYMMGLLHDVGKIGVPGWIINKNGKLTDEEYAEIKKHPVVGHKILKKVEEMPLLSCGARWHHERFDGGGYPDGLSGMDIPEAARIIAVADAYDAMTSTRSYRDALSREKVMSEIENGKGSQFDPQMADIMIGMMKEDTDYTMREGTAEEADLEEKSETEAMNDSRIRDTLPDELAQMKGMDTTVGLTLCGDVEDYLEALEIFADSIPSKAAKIEEALESKDMDSYTTLVHSLKSAAHTVGAVEISELARQLEIAGKAQDTATIQAQTPALLSLYRSMEQPLKGIIN